MGFEQNPEYEFLRGLFRKVMSKENYTFDNQYDWSSKEKSKVKLSIIEGSFEFNF
jgi:hypothetical protein